MSTAYALPNLPFWQRFFFRIPVIGWVARDVLFGDKNNLWFALVLFVSAWACAALVFGLPGLYLPAVSLVPIIFVALILISRG